MVGDVCLCAFCFGALVWQEMLEEARGWAKWGGSYGWVERIGRVWDDAGFLLEC
jgi:hypothetical protein